MPKAAKLEPRDTLFRQWTMLQRIPRYPRRITTQAIVAHLRDQGFPVTSRTVERDLSKLSTIFGYTCDEEGRSYHWFWPADFKTIDIPGLDPNTALAFSLAEKHLAHLLPPPTLELLTPYFRRAAQVLDTALDSPISDWRSKVRVIGIGPSLAPPPVDADIQRRLYEGLLNERQVALSYMPRGESETRSYDFSPLALVSRQGILYCVGALWDYDNVVQLALHRIRSATLTETPTHVPTGFDIDSYIEQEGKFSYPTGTGTIRLVLSLDHDTAQHLIERPLSEDQQTRTTEDGRVQLNATVLETDELAWWILGFGANAEVLKPIALRRKVAAALADAAARYS